MEKYPDHETYRALYARYHEKGVAELLELLEPLGGKSVLDLCGGDGRLTTGALAAGAGSVTLADREIAMIPSGLSRRANVRVSIGDVADTLVWMASRGEAFDRVACQQAINYWLDEVTAKSVAEVLKPGGIFAFNTFNQKPAEQPRVLEYNLGGHSFVEVSWLVGDTVHHLQVRDGLEPHHTEFMWLSPERLRELLDPHFVVIEERHGKTSLYRCEKK